MHTATVLSCVMRTRIIWTKVFTCQRLKYRHMESWGWKLNSVSFDLCFSVCSLMKFPERLLWQCIGRIAAPVPDAACCCNWSMVCVQALQNRVNRWRCHFRHAFGWNRGTMHHVGAWVSKKRVISQPIVKFREHLSKLLGGLQRRCGILLSVLHQLIRVNNEHSVSVCWSHYECIYQLAVGCLYCTLRTVVVYEIKSNMSAAGRVTAGLAESNGSRRHVCMCDVTLCKMYITKCVSYLPIKRQHAHGHHYQSPPK